MVLDLGWSELWGARSLSSVGTYGGNTGCLLGSARVAAVTAIPTCQVFCSLGCLHVSFGSSCRASAVE